MTKDKLTDVVTRLSNMQQKANNLTHAQEEIIIDSMMMLNDIKKKIIMLKKGLETIYD